MQHSICTESATRRACIGIAIDPADNILLCIEPGQKVEPEGRPVALPLRYVHSFVANRAKRAHADQCDVLRVTLCTYFHEGLPLSDL